MNRSFHYYTIGYLALSAQIPKEDALTIAYASQYVDDNLVEYSIEYHGETIRTMPTQNFGFLEQKLAHRIYIPFHFFPGESMDRSIRRDRKTNPLATIPNSPLVKKMLVAALKTKNLYRIGIALHTFADSWAHQNCTGQLEDFNKNSDNPMIPPIGHAPFLGKPDRWNESWTDPRLKEPKVKNNHRFIRAAKKIYRYLCLYNGISYQDEDLVTDILLDLVCPMGKAKTQEEIELDFQLKFHIDPYDRALWFNQAIRPQVEGSLDDIIGRNFGKLGWFRDHFLHRTEILPREPLIARSHFRETSFYRWHGAAQEHYRLAREILRPLIDLPHYFL